MDNPLLSERRRLLAIVVALTTAIFMFQNCATIPNQNLSLESRGHMVAPATPLKIIYLPKKIQIPEGESHILRPLVQGDDLRYRWLVDKGSGDQIYMTFRFGSPVLSMPEFFKAQAGQYTLEVRDRYGEVAMATVLFGSTEENNQKSGQMGNDQLPSDSMELSVERVMDHLGDVRSRRPSKSSFSLMAEVRGGSVSQAQWYLDGEPIQGARSLNYFKSSISEKDSGIYSIKVTDKGGRTSDGGHYQLFIRNPEVH